MPRKKAGEIKLIMPKHTSSIDHFRLALKVCAAHPAGIEVTPFTDELFAELKTAGLETVKNSDNSHYTKCLQLPRYFGFVRYCLSGERSNAITPSGKEMLAALSASPIDANQAIGLILTAILRNNFGRNNEGLGSESYCEPLAILFRASDRLNGISCTEYGYLIENMDQNGRPFIQVLNEIQQARTSGTGLQIALNSEAKNISDWKTVLFLCNLNFLFKDSGGLVSIAGSISDDDKKQLLKLPLYSIGYKKQLFMRWLKNNGLSQSVDNYPTALEAISEDFGEKDSGKFEGFFKRLTGSLPKKKVFEVSGLQEYDNVYRLLNHFWQLDEAKGFSPFAEDRFYECYYYAKAKNKIDNGRLYNACNSYRDFLKWFDANHNDFDINDAEFQVSEGELVETLIPLDDLPLQRIFYGAPGTGKSFQTDKVIKDKKYTDTIRVTFHPDSDYASFVGCYKPAMEKRPRTTFSVSGTGFKVEKGPASPADEDFITYRFVPQAFTEAYELAWRKMAEWMKNGGDLKRQYLVIEEINRGNCAQIFGDLFQLLDRDDKGYSKYPVDPDADLAKHLHDWFRGEFKDGAGNPSPKLVANEADEEKWKAMDAGAVDPEKAGESPTWDDILSGRKLVLPPNLYIWATMNTSDQSLFPMDSAFKRRWDWKYVPIRNHTEKNWAIVVDETRKYDWWDFLKQINDVVFSKTNSEDKQLGYFFVQAKDGVVDLDTFVNKVVFYLWNTVFKDCYTECDFLKDGDRKDANGAQAYLHFSKFFDDDGKAKPDAAGQLLDKLQVKKFSPAAPAPVAPPATPAPAAAPAAPAPVAPPATPAPAAAPAPPSV